MARSLRQNGKFEWCRVYVVTVDWNHCTGIFDEIDDATIAIDETTILEIKATIWPWRYFQKSFLKIKILFGKSSCDNWMLVFIEDELSIVI